MLRRNPTIDSAPNFQIQALLVCFCFISRTKPNTLRIIQYYSTRSMSYFNLFTEYNDFSNNATICSVQWWDVLKNLLTTYILGTHYYSYYYYLKVVIVNIKNLSMPTFCSEIMKEKNHLFKVQFSAEKLLWWLKHTTITYDEYNNK